jgi:DNA-binding XRE family transcriptional regulator
MAMASSPRGGIDPREVREKLAVSREVMGRLLEVSAKTIERWEDQGKWPSRPESIQRLGMIAEITRLGLVIYTRQGFTEFLKTPLAEFGGRSAIQLMAADEGDKVLGALAADYEGAGY